MKLEHRIIEPTDYKRTVDIRFKASEVIMLLNRLIEEIEADAEKQEASTDVIELASKLAYYLDEANDLQ